MEMILIADAGSTKTAWCVTDSRGTVIDQVRTAGINPSTMPTSEIAAIINGTVRPVMARYTTIRAVRFYGAGVVSPEAAARVSGALSVLGTAQVTVESDMVGAARALLGDRPGIACILGTGSNSCQYDGHTVTRNVPSLGYILGDEGSGASLGRRLVSDILKGLMPGAVSDKWKAETGLSVPDVIERVYRQPAANAFLASQVPFIVRHIYMHEVRSLVDDEFDRFFTRNVERYGSDARRVGFVGSVALHLADRLRLAASRHGYEVTDIIADPMPGLIHYHTRS